MSYIQSLHDYETTVYGIVQYYSNSLDALSYNTTSICPYDMMYLSTCLSIVMIM